MARTEILVARHGETDWNRLRRWQGSSDIPLNDTGISQARELGRSLRNAGVSRIFASSLKRARSTAEIVSGIIGSPLVRTDDRLRERSLGRFEGWRSLEVSRYLEMPDEYAVRLENDELLLNGEYDIEKWEDFTARVWKAMDDVLSESGEETSLVVAHGGVMRAITMALDGPGTERINFHNVEFLKLVSDNGIWMLLD